VPVLRNTEKMTFADIEKTIALFGNKAKNGTLALEEMTGKQLIRLQVYTDF
jgi:2-oxoglutarate dehydrogenase E2 component (dihydrolipoamide succinyltransferase)